MIAFEMKGKNGAWAELRTESNPQMSETLDESFDTLQMTLMANSDEEPYEPDADVRAILDDKSVRMFTLISDEVSLASSYPLMYKHTLTLAQNIAKWKKYLIRNCIFTQPPSDEIAGRCSCSITSEQGYLWDEYDPYSVSLPFDPHMKLRKAYQRWDLRLTHWDGSAMTYVTERLKRLPKGDVYVESVTGIRVRLFSFSTASTNDQGEWKEMSESNAQKIRNLAKYGPVRIIVVPSYQRNESIADAYTVVQSHPGALLTVDFEVRCEVHYHTMYDVLKGLREICSQKVGSSYRKPIPYELPTSGDFYQKLKSDIAPNFTWTQSTLYEALQDFFSYYDSIMTLDADGVIGMEEMKATGAKALGTPIGMSAASSSDERVNGMVNFYSRAKQSVSFPDSKGTLAKVRSSTIGVPGEEDFSMVLPEPVDHITKVEMYIGDYMLRDSTGNVVTDAASLNQPIDVTERFIESSVWQNLPQTIQASDTRNDVLLQCNTIPYSKGSRSISISRKYGNSLNVYQHFLQTALRCCVYGWIGIGKNKMKALGTTGGYTSNGTFAVNSIVNPSDGAWNQVFFRIEYVASVSGKVRSVSPANRIEREMIATQGGADCDMDKLGRMMSGLIKRTGNDSKSVTFAITDWGKTPKKGDEFEGRIVSKVDYRITPEGGYSANAELSKGFNRLSMRTKIDRAKRMTNVSDDLVQDCEDILTEYVYLTSNPDIPSNEISIGRAALMEMIDSTFSGIQSASIDIAHIATRSATAGAIADNLAIPMRKYRFGSCVCMEMRYESSMSAGNSMEITSGWFGSTAYYSKPTLYADSAGFFDECDVVLAMIKGQWSDSYPRIDASRTTEVGKIDSYSYLKKPNEIFGVNYQVCFLVDPEQEDELIIGEEFLMNNGLLDRTSGGGMKLYYNKDGGYKDGEIPDGECSSVEVVTSTPDGKFTIRCNIPEEKVKSWALTDKEGNVYIARNAPQDAPNGKIDFYFAPNKFRL